MRAATTKAKVEGLMRGLGAASTGPGRIYFTGGASAVLLGWRETTVDIDMKLDPEPPGVFGAIPSLKDELDLNVELAAPDDFIPALPGWRDRCLFIDRCGPVDYFHYDFYGQALAKLERMQGRDPADLLAMVTHSLIMADRLWELFQAIEPGLLRFPAIETRVFRERVRTFVDQHER